MVASKISSAISSIVRLLFCLSIEQDEIRSSDKNTIFNAESLWRKIHLFLKFESHYTENQKLWCPGEDLNLHAR